MVERMKRKCGKDDRPYKEMSFFLGEGIKNCPWESIPCCLNAFDSQSQYSSVFHF